MLVTITLRRAVTVLSGLLALGLIVAWSGIINVAASTGHWSITDWFLHWAMRNSVRTQTALTVDEPATDPSGLISAAGHYAASCAICHGAPGELPSPVMRAATPSAPDLADTVSTYSGAQLFWIIKHGVKFTAMPAWPVQNRDDEVRRMAAFVQRLPNMSVREYRHLAYGSSRMGGMALTRLEDALADCERCHADDGRGQPEIPVLEGQKAAYLQASLEAYAAGRRSSGVMSSAAARVTPAVMRELAEHYAKSPGLSDSVGAIAAVSGRSASAECMQAEVGGSALPARLTPAALMAERIVTQGLPQANLPACSKCHAPGKRPHYPRLAGQKMQYMAARLRRWRGDHHIVEARKPNESMPMIARRIPEELIEPLAQYYSAEGRARVSCADHDRQTTTHEGARE